MENSYFKNRVTFPVIPDGATLTPDHRVIMTNQQLLTRNPDARTEQFESQSHQRTSGAISPETAEQVAVASGAAQNDTFETRRQTPTMAGKRPLGKSHNAAVVEPIKKKSSVVEESKKRARENAAPPKKLKPYENPLDRLSSDELGIKGLVNKKVKDSQHALGKSVSSFDKVAARAGQQSLFDGPHKDYFASKHQYRDQVDIEA
ncbi:MAG: hypothetical protein LBS41_01770 [Streptococcaceae bacterium]|jgi:hypothetical protein|nr:hypothetical protein [Streptococcaceae bacterium]